MKPQFVRSTALVALVFVLGAGTVFAQNCTSSKRSNFSLSLDVSGACGSKKFDTAKDLIDGLETDALRNTALNGVYGAYTGSEVTSLNMRFNSLPIHLDFPNLGNTGNGALLQFSIPQLGVNQAFHGADRDDSIDQLEDYLKKSGIINDIMKYQVAHTANNPITGPGGLLPTTVAADFGLNPEILPDGGVSGPVGNQFGVAPEFGSASFDGRSSKSVTLPLSYTIRNDIDPRRQLMISLPITMIETEGAKSYTGSIGVAYRFPITRAWTLTPAVRYGFSGSADLAAAAAMYGASLSSNYVLRFTGFDLAIGNMVGYYQTGKFKVSGYTIDPDIKNTVLRNGVLVSQPINIGERAMSLEYSLIDTRYLGTKLYTDNTQEIGVSVGSNRGTASARSNLRAGLKYLHGRDVKSFMLNVGYWF
jgi:hypothetical protein